MRSLITEIIVLSAPIFAKLLCVLIRESYERKHRRWRGAGDGSSEIDV